MTLFNKIKSRGKMMKKLLFVPALLLSASLLASEYNYEITPQIGFNLAEGNLDLKNQMLGGVALQYNGFDSYFAPELSYLYTRTRYEGFDDKIKTDINRVALNAVHEFESVGSFVPLFKIGAGYETISKHEKGNTDSVFFDAGVGAKVPVAENLALKLETIYMIKDNDRRWDNNLAILAGLSYAFGAKEKPAPVVVEETPPPPPAPVAVPKPTPAPAVVVDGDDDGDGVLNSMDKCPNTPRGHKVDADGCSVLVNLQVNFAFDSYKVEGSYMPRIKEFADFMKSMPEYDAKIVGHTDGRGSRAYNQKLSENRANAVKDLIVSEGVESSRVSSSGMGKDAPIATNDTAEGRAENRRIEAELKRK